jgi:hypothetical protein
MNRQELEGAFRTLNEFTVPDPAQRMPPGSMALRISPGAWIRVQTDPAYRPAKLVDALLAPVFGIDVVVDETLPAYSWRLVVKGDPEEIRAQGMITPRGGDDGLHPVQP